MSRRKLTPVEAAEIAGHAKILDDVITGKGYEKRPRKLVVPGLEVALPDKPKRKAKPGQSIINSASRGNAEAQRIATPWEFIHALGYRFGTPVDFDLAADVGNAKAPEYWTEAHDALVQDWTDIVVVKHPGLHETESAAELAYNNPPFAQLMPWAKKLADCRWLNRWTVMLAPSSYSCDWFQFLKGKVQIDAIPRIQFEGATNLYPKDLAVFIAGFGMNGEGFWDWRVDYYRHVQETVGRTMGESGPFPVTIAGKPFPGKRRALPAYPFFPDCDWTEDTRSMRIVDGTTTDDRDS